MKFSEKFDRIIADPRGMNAVANSIVLFVIFALIGLFWLIDWLMRTIS